MRLNMPYSWIKSKTERYGNCRILNNFRVFLVKQTTIHTVQAYIRRLAIFHGILTVKSLGYRYTCIRIYRYKCMNIWRWKQIFVRILDLPHNLPIFFPHFWIKVYKSLTIYGDDITDERQRTRSRYASFVKEGKFAWYVPGT